MTQLSPARWRTDATLCWRRQPAPQSESELLLRARHLVGQRIDALAEAVAAPLPREPKRAKGFVGQLLEAALGSDVDAGERPDFVRLGIELKSVPIGARGRPTQSPFVCSIRLGDAQNATFEGSRLQRRLGCVLFVLVQAAQTAPLPRRRVVGVHLWRPSAGQWQQLRADWEDLMGAIGAGRGHSLGAQEGVALQVRPKAANRRARAVGPTPEGVGEMMPLGFYLRAGFLAEVLAAAR